VHQAKPTTDDDLIAKLEACTLPPDQFHHADHVRAAWLYLSQFPALEAIARFSVALRAYAASLGKAGRYHERSPGRICSW
jgi:hypothetical protein